jgi:D-arabinose 1-dehydrogenase-like Zn-dependent alcohol dehydrogenase
MKSLREYGTFNEKGRVDMAALSQLARSLEPLLPSPTGWNALYGIKPLKLGGVVLTQWIGDASIFAVQVAKAAGATAIATTSPAKKVSVLKKLGAGTWLFERRRYLSNPLFSCWLRMGC